MRYIMEDALQSFADSVYKHITSINNDKIPCSTIIRKHSESLHKHGDFSFPSKPKPWLSHIPVVNRNKDNECDKYLKTICHPSTLTEASSKWSLNICRISYSLERINLFINRQHAIKIAIAQCEINAKFIENSLSNDGLRIHEDLSRKHEDSLSNLRVKLVRKFIHNLCKICLSPEDDLLEILVTSRSILEAPTGTQVVLCGPVLNANTSTKEAAISAEEFVKSRQTDMMLIAQHKYGVRTSNNNRWKHLVMQLGDAAVKFELLQTRPSTAVKIDFDHQAAGCSKGAAFVLYNCARLETLVSSFEEKDSYQPLPSLEETDFFLLTDEDEWSLAYNYVLSLPSVLRSCLHTEKDRVVVAPQSLCRFISSLVRTFSQYYRRVRILTEARAHMMGVLHARMRLLLALRTVLRTSLRLLHIDAVTRM